MRETVKTYENGCIDCTQCKWHNYDGFGDMDFEICDKSHELYPENCQDFESYRYRIGW